MNGQILLVECSSLRPTVFGLDWVSSSGKGPTGQTFPEKGRDSEGPKQWRYQEH